MSKKRSDNHKSKDEEITLPVYRAKFSYSCENEYCTPSEGMELEKGSYVIAETRYGRDMLEILGKVEDLRHIRKENLRSVIRIANDADIAKKETLDEKARESFSICKKKIESHKLDMKLVTAHYLLDEPKVMFFFTADNRIDFRELVKDLVADFRMRIELRQIGVRDESRYLGGVAVCGRQLCCHGVMDYLHPVSIKMAKEQNLSLNSLKISGPCGRLLCCLSYEYDYYVTEKKKFPSEGFRISCGKVNFRVSDINIFSGKIVLSGPEGRYFSISRDKFTYLNDKNRWVLNSLPENF